MENSDIKSRGFSQTTLGSKRENGMWELTVVMTESVVYNDGTERSESIETMCVDEDFFTAQQVALRAALTELQDLVYSRGLDSIIEGRDYQRRLEEHDTIEIDKDSSTKQYSD